MTSIAKATRRTRGFSLIEALISMVMIAAIVLALVGVVPYGFDEVQVNASQVQATAVAQQYLDALRNAKESNNPLPVATTAPIDQGNSFVSGSADSGGLVFTITPNTCPSVVTGTTASEYDCSVTVSWTENNQTDSTTVESYVTQ
jgi:type II secretory pathway pseudopilin PulG